MMQAPIRLLKKPSWFGEFTAFIMRGNVVDLAVGIIIGSAFTAIVTSLVKDLFTPLLGLVVGGIDFSNLFITLKGPSAPTLDAAKAAGAVTLNIGLFLNACISFLIKVINRFIAKKEDEAPLPPTLSEQTLLEIRDLLARRDMTAGVSPGAPKPI